ncbi:MAG: erythromycin esterase family protein [Prolixibacteraceae bacterium]
MDYFDKRTNRTGNSVETLEKKSYDLEKGLEPLMKRIGNSRIVLLGEASHGTHEYYIWRAQITQRLIREKGFNIIAVEGDWPDCYQINRYVRNYENSGKSSLEVLNKFHRWPTWMWANWEISALIDWLKKINENKPHNQQTGFYGLDVYSLWESLDEIMNYLKKNDPDALKEAEKAMQCFEPYDREGQDYAAHSRFTPETCEQEVLNLLQKIRKRVPLYDTDPEAPFNTEQNAMVAVNAEKYYREMVKGGPGSWNVRDRHMINTLEKLLNFHGPESKAVVWEHNTHIGDARATDMYRNGMVNVGQLAREKWGTDNTVLVGFGSYKGSVIAGRSWGDKMQKMEVPEARSNSWEEMLHFSAPENKLIITDDLKSYPEFSERHAHRAIGVVYNPEMESYGNYVPSIIPKRYDAFIFLDETKALHPLKIKPEKQETPETYPWGL